MTLRPSTEAAIQRTGAAIGRLIMGSVLMGAGFWFDYLEYRQPPTHTAHLALFTGVAGCGVLLMPAIFDALFPRVQKVFVLVFPNGIPLLGGRRAGDPPASPPTNTGDKG